MFIYMQFNRIKANKRMHGHDALHELELPQIHSQSCDK